MTIVDRVLISSALVGRGNEIAHVELILGPRGSAAETAFCQRVLTNPDGAESLLVSLAPNLPCMPNTLLVNHNTLTNPRQTLLLYGPIQKAVAKAVTEFVLNGSIEPAQVNDLYLMISTFIHASADDEKRIFEQNFTAVSLALDRALGQIQSEAGSEDMRLEQLRDHLRKMPDEPYQ